MPPEAAAPYFDAIADANPVVTWLLADGWRLRTPKELTTGLATVLVGAGVPLSRVRITLRTLHPQLAGTSFTWTRAGGGTEVNAVPYAVLETDAYLQSPYAAIFEGAGAVRRRIKNDSEPLDYPILRDLKKQGATDYVAMPFEFSDGQINAITVTTDAPGGFASEHLAFIDGSLSILGMVMEARAMRYTARTLLDTYLGRHSGGRVLDGNIKRGDGEDIHAVIWFCDLRASTPLAESMDRAAFLGLLNDFFECMAGAVLDHGGEVLRFIGDAVLGIFPINERTADPRRCPEHRHAAGCAEDAAKDAMARMQALNDRRAAAGEPALGFGIALHLGEIMYGNIGVPERLEFSVIGAAANEAARLEQLCKTLHKPLLVSGDFAAVAPNHWVSLGSHQLAGVDGQREVFTFAEFT